MSIIKKNKKNKKDIAAGYTRSQLELAIDGLLLERHCALYGRAYDIFDDDCRAQCVTSLADTFEKIDSRL